MGFWRGVSDYIPECLQPRYYEQLYVNVFKYKKIVPRTYIIRLEIKWVILDKL